MSCANLITLQGPFKYGYLDLNQGQLAPKASILPTELHPYIAESSVFVLPEGLIYDKSDNISYHYSYSYFYMYLTVNHNWDKLTLGSLCYY